MERKPELYLQHGSYGNNTTIPEDERQIIVSSLPEAGCEDGRLSFRGEEAMHHFYQEWGLKPVGTWSDIEDTPMTPLTPIWTKPLPEQRQIRGILSKSDRNREDFIKYKPRRAKKFIRAENQQQYL
jgi:hypothetical protein